MTQQQAPRPWREDFPKLWELTQDMLFGDVWERSALSKRDRSVVTVAVNTALYRTDQLRQHVNRALDNGVTKDEIIEIITHVTMYAGWPCGVNGAAVASEVFAARNL